MKAKNLMCVFFLLFAIAGKSQKNIEIKNESTDKSIIGVVERTFHRYVDSIPEQYMSNYGIHNRKEIQLLRFGKPIEMFEISNKQEIVSSNMWRVPALINNEYRALFTVIKGQTGEFKNVNYGAVQLANQISKVAGDSSFIGLLRVHKINEDFFIYSTKNNELEFIPIFNEISSKVKLEEIIKSINQ